MKEQQPNFLARNWSELAQRANYSTSRLALLCGLSGRQLERDFKLMMHQSPKRWLQELRLRAGRKLLDEGVSVKEAAYFLGYKSRPEHFSRDFRKFFGISPSDICRAS